jgi:hypothetical protein
MINTPDEGPTPGSGPQASSGTTSQADDAWLDTCPIRGLDVTWRQAFDYYEQQAADCYSYLSGQEVGRPTNESGLWAASAP